MGGSNLDERKSGKEGIWSWMTEMTSREFAIFSHSQLPDKIPTNSLSQSHFHQDIWSAINTLGPGQSCQSFGGLCINPKPYNTLNFTAMQYLIWYSAEVFAGVKYICTKRKSRSGFIKHFTAIAGNNIKHDTPRADLYFLPKEKLKLNVLSIAKCISSDK